MYCSVPDPDSENEMHVVHKDSKRCYTSKTFECPNCQTFCESAKNLNDHMKEKHEEPSSLSLMSDNSSDSWMFGVVTPPAKKQRTKGPQEFKCETCDTNFSRNLTLQHHMNNKH